MHTAEYFRKKPDGAVVCTLCPHQCIIKPEQYGTCGARVNHAGELFAATWGKVTALHNDPIEKKPLYHFHPGSMILSVGSFGCNMNCSFCQNHHISQPEALDKLPYKSYTPLEIVELAEQLPGNSGIAYTYNEPSVWYEFMMDIAIPAKEKGLKNAVVSNGFINPEPLNRLLEVIDAFNIDLKGFTPEFYQERTGSELKPVLKTLKTIADRGNHLEITHLVIPGLNDNQGNFREMVKWISNEVGRFVPLHISRYFPNHKLRLEPTPLDTMLAFYEIAREELAWVYLGNVHSKSGVSDTKCPQCGTTVIERGGYTTNLKNAMPDGKCSKCKFQIFKIITS